VGVTHAAATAVVPASTRGQAVCEEAAGQLEISKAVAGGLPAWRQRLWKDEKGLASRLAASHECPLRSEHPGARTERGGSVFLPPLSVAAALTMSDPGLAPAAFLGALDAARMGHSHVVHIELGDGWGAPRHRATLQWAQPDVLVLRQEGGSSNQKLGTAVLFSQAREGREPGHAGVAEFLLGARKMCVLGWFADGQDGGLGAAVRELRGAQRECAYVVLIIDSAEAAAAAAAVAVAAAMAQPLRADLIVRAQDARTRLARLGGAGVEVLVVGADVLGGVEAMREGALAGDAAVVLAAAAAAAVGLASALYRRLQRWWWPQRTPHKLQ
jgi:hypothetical protein